MKYINHKLTKIFLYLVIVLLVFILFSLQIKTSRQADPFFLIIFFMLYVTAFELFSNTVGIIMAATVSILEITYLFYQSPNQPQNYSLLIALVVLLPAYYFLIKFLRKRKLEVALAKEKHFQTLINVNLQPMVLKNNKGEVLFASESIKDLLGLNKNIAVGKNILEYIYPEDIHIYNNFLKQILESPGEKKSAEFRVKKAEKEWIWVRNDAVNLLGHKEIKAIVSSIQDITFQKELDREKVDIIKQEKYERALAEKAVRDRDEFLSIASHELKTPLTTVLLQLQATLRKISTQSLADFSGSELLNSLQIAEKQSKSLGGLIQDLLNISVASTGKLSLNKERVNLSNIVESLSRKYAEEIKLSNCHVTTKIKTGELVGDWDPIRIEQAISNLFMNALKYAQGKNILLVTKNEDGWGVFKIKDEGVGIAEELQAEIFKPFNRASSNSNVEGLGVGLFIAKQIILAHGGNLSVRSKVGKGSTFTLRLPLAG